MISSILGECVVLYLVSDASCKSLVIITYLDSILLLLEYSALFLCLKVLRLKNDRFISVSVDLFLVSHCIFA